MQNSKISPLDQAITKSWSKISPSWPLENSIAVNPLQGLEDLPVEKAIIEATIYFQQKDFPEELNVVNRQTIKWLKAFFDKGQAAIAMPLRVNGLYLSLRSLIYFDQELFLGNREENQQWLKSLPDDPNVAIIDILKRLNISENDFPSFLTLSLTTLPGWASYLKYLAEWSNEDIKNKHNLRSEYLVIRLIFIYLLWPKALTLLSWYNSKKLAAHDNNMYDKMVAAEQRHQKSLVQELKKEIVFINTRNSNNQVQMIFCIDVRSEPFRKAIESVGDYETLGFAGFFGLNLRIEDLAKAQAYDSCPVLLASKNTVRVTSCNVIKLKFFETIQRLYQSMKYTFTVPFMLVEVLGPIMGIGMGLKTISPRLLGFLKTKVDEPVIKTCLDIRSISFQDQCEYAETVLTMLGLTNNFKKLIVFCGHGSSSKNNSYAAGLDCGACGGRPGGNNARILAMILNSLKVREYLKHKNIDIPSESFFLGAEHNTTTDEFVLYESDAVGLESLDSLVSQLKADLDLASTTNCLFRARLMDYMGKDIDAPEYIKDHSKDWAQVRPEWGLAGNASFIIAPRDLTKNINLGGRSFLHSYDYSNDPEGLFLTTILTAPVIVAQWINYQYLFSTVDNVAYGSGSKVTQNIIGKFGIMQGNSSDLMSGLPLQSLYLSDNNAYHEPVRLQVFVYAPQALLDNIISANSILQKLFGNGWVILICIEPVENDFYLLNRDFSWSKIDE